MHDAALREGRLDHVYRMTGGDGVTRWVRDRGRVRREGGSVFLDGSVLDVTVVQEAQQEVVAMLEQSRRTTRSCASPARRPTTSPAPTC